jgi:protein ImuA
MGTALGQLQAEPARWQALEGVWRADELARPQQRHVPSGHEALDAELPGQGWPLGQLTEILQAQAGQHEWRLLLPALRQAVGQGQGQGPLVLVGAPQLPHLPALASAGIPTRQVLRVDADTAAERLWAAEQVLRCRKLGALLVWLPQARPESLRRLQLASTATQALVFAFRPVAVRHESSPAPLRLVLQAMPEASKPDLGVAFIKRRGPPIDHLITLAAPLPVMAALRKRSVLKEPAHVVDRVAPPMVQRRQLQRLTA